MKEVEKVDYYRQLQYESYFNQENSPCNGTENISIIVHKKKVKTRKKYSMFKFGQQPAIAFRFSHSGCHKNRNLLTKHTSLLEINKRSNLVKRRTRSVDATSRKKPYCFNSKFIVNRVSDHHFNERISPFMYSTQKKWKVYRCQVTTNQESCCCSCNSDAMFEVMKSLYDCYKKKNCDNCKCILCAHLPREERRLGEAKKSLASVGLAGSAKEIKEKVKRAEKMLEGKTKAEKERILKELATTGQPLPKGKTASEKSLIKKVRKDLGLPPKPKTAAEADKMRKAQAAGIITPLEGKTTAQKEKILKAQADMGITLPEGRTASEKALIQKIKTEKGIKGMPSEKLRKAKELGLLTPLEGKSPQEKEKIIRGLAMQGIPIPEGKTTSEKKLIDKVRADLGLPPEPKTPSMRDKYDRAAKAGLMQPLEGKSAKEKEKILHALHDMGIPLPEGRTASEKALIAKVKAGPRVPSIAAPSEKLRKAKAAGLLTPLEGKSPEQKEKILRGLAMQGIPLPEGKTASDRKLIDKVRADLGLPPEPKTPSMKDKYQRAADAGILQPLEGKSKKEKQRILQNLHDMGIPLPEGRTASEKSLIAKVKAGVAIEPSIAAPPEKIQKAKAAGLLTPLEGKSPKEKEKILRGLAMEGIELPEGKTASERKLIDKVRADLGLPPEPKSPSMKDKYNRAAKAGLMQPLEGKSANEKEKILHGLHDMGIPLPEGRTASEKALIAKVKAGPRVPSIAAPSEKLRKAKAAGLLTPLEGKPPEQKEKILRGLAMQGIPLPEGKTASDRKLIDKVRADLGLPPEPKTPSMKDKYQRAADAGILQPLEGKSKKEKQRILQNLHDMGIPLPEGRTASEKSLIAKVKAGVAIEPSIAAPPEKIQKAKAAGLLTPLEGKSPKEKEKILRGLAMEGIELPEGKTASERKLIDKVRADLGLPPEPKSPSMKDKYNRAAKAGLMQPLEGKSANEKEKILHGLHDMGIPLPEGRTASEKALIAKVKAGPRVPSIAAPSEKLRKAKAAGLLTPLEGKPPEQKEKILRGLAMQGIPLPEGKTASDRKLIDKVRADLGLPPEPKTPSMKDKYQRAADAGILQPLEGKSKKEKQRILQNLHDMGIPLPEGRTASEKSLIAKVKAGVAIEPSIAAPPEKIQKAKAAGLLTPLEGKSPKEKEKILRGLAMEGIELPEGKTASERKLIDKVRADLGLPPEPKSPSMKDKYNRAAKAGLMQPLEGKSAKEKEKILHGLHDMGIPLPEGRTASEKALIAKVKAGSRVPSIAAPSEKLRKAKAAGLLTPLEGKSPEQKEKILRGLAMQGIPLPEGKTASDRKLIDKVRADLGLPPEPKTPSMKDKYQRAADAGILQPLEGKSKKEKERILQNLHDMGIPLPEGRTASEKALIAKVKAEAGAPPVVAPSEKLRKAKAAGLLTPLEGKSPAQKEKILRGLAMEGIPLPEGKTASEKKLIDKVRADLGLPPEPKTPSMKEKYNKAADAGLLQPLEGKSNNEKERILQGLHDMGIPLPEGRTSSEKALIAKVKASPRAPSLLAPSEKLRRAKAAGLLTPLAGKSPAQREKILRGLAMQGIPLPEAKTASEKMLIDKVRTDLGLPPEPKTASMKEKHAKAAEAGLLQPLEGKSAKEKEKILQGLHDMGIQLPEGRTASEKAIIAKVKASPRPPTVIVPSEKMRKAKAAGLLTPLEGKSPAQKEKILRGLAMHGIPLPEGKTASEKKLIDKVRADVGLPPPPKTAADKETYNKALAAGLITPLEGKSPSEKERILRGQHEMGLELPEGRTASEKSLIRQIQAGKRRKSRAVGVGPEILSEKLRRAKAAGLLTPLAGKSKKEKEKILRGLAKEGIPLPEATTASEKKLTDKIRKELGLPPEPQTPSMKAKHEKAAAAGILKPLEGLSPAEKEKVLRAQQDMGIALPEGRTASEKALIAKVKASAAPSITTEKLRKAKAAGLLTPLEGKTPEHKEKILRGLVKAGLPLPEGKTVSEKALIRKIKKELGVPEVTPSEKVRSAIKKGVLTPLEGKTLSQKEKVLRGRAAAGLPLPVGKTPSERALIQKIKQDTGYVSPTPSERMRKAKAAGLLTPLEGKTPSMKEKILRERIAAGVPIEEGKTPSEREIIKRITAGPPHARVSEKLRQAKAAGLLTPLEGKTPEQKEKILRGLVKTGLPLPEPKTASEKNLINKIRHDFGLPPEPTTPSMKEKYRKAQEAGIITPLEGKPKAEKEKILRKLQNAGIPLPEGRTPSEKSLIAKIKTEGGITSEKLRRAKAAGVLTPLKGKTRKEKEKILRGLAKEGLPLPEPSTASEKIIQDKIRKELGLPPEKTVSEKEKVRKAQAKGLITPLEGKTHEEKERILKALAEAGVHLPEGRTATERALIKKLQGPPALPPEKRRKLDMKTAKVMKEGKGPSDECICGLLTPESEREALPTKPSKILSEKLRKAKAAGLLTPLEGKTHAEKEKILRGLAMEGIPLPEPTTASEKKLIDKINKDLGLPPEPKTRSLKEKQDKAKAAGIIKPLEGLTAAEKEKVLRAEKEMGLELPEGRTASEKALIAKIKAEAPPTKIPSEKLRRAKAAGLLTPLAGKSKKEKERILRGLAKEGIPLPEATTASEKKLTNKIRKELGLPPEPKTPSMREKHEKAAAAGVLKPLEGLSPAEKEKVLRAQKDMGIALPEGRTASEKALIAKIAAEPQVHKIPTEKLRRAKAAGVLTPLHGKTHDEKERIIRGLAMEGIPLPEPSTASEKKLIDKINKELGLPPEPKTRSMKEKQDKAKAAGIIKPLEGLTAAEKEKVLRAEKEMGLELPEGRTASEKALIAKIKAEGTPPKIPSEKLRRAKAAGLLTPLAGKGKQEKERILRGLAKEGIPLPEATTASEKKLTDKIRKELGLPPEPQTPSMKEKHEKAAAAGILKPLEGLSPAEKEKLLRAQKDMGIALPEGRTASEKALIAKIAAEPPPHKLPSEKLRRAKAAGLLTPLHGKTHDEKERILKGLAMEGIPLPEPSTASEKKLIDKINKELGLPPEPKTLSMKEKQDKAKAAGIIKPLEGLTAAEKEKVLRAEKEMGLELPEGRTASEKALIAKIKAEGPPPKIPSEKLRRAKAAGLLTPLAGKSKQEKERILRGLAKEGIPLPEATTASEKKLTDKIRKELGLPPEPQTPSMKEKHEKAAAAGILKPLEGLSPAEKEKLLRAQKDMGIALPEGRTASEKALIAKIAAEPPPHKLPSEKLRRAKAAGLLTPLHGKTHDEKERILKGLAMEGIPLPEPSTASEKKLIDKINKELGLPPEPKTLSMKEKQDKAKAAGIIKPLEGLTAAEKEKVLRAEKEMGLELPEGRTASEKALIAKIKAEGPPPKIPSEKLRRAKAAGLLTPLAGKSKQEKERILRGLAKEGIPLPEATTASEKKLTDKIRKELGLPPEPQTPSMKEKHEKAAAAGILKPLEGLSPAEKEKLLRAQKDMGIALPEGRTASEKALIAKIAAEPPPHKLPSEKLRRAKAAGLLTPLHGKTHDEKERILKGLAMEGIPLPEPSTASEKKLIDKINKELGLPPEPKTLSMKEKQDKAKAAGIIKPLEGLTAAEKEKVLRAEKEMGLELPEGRTASEKALIAKIKAEGPPPKIPSEKLRRAKAAGLLTPLAGKSKQEKERILRGLAKEGIPLPEATTASEKKLTDKIRKELGLPPEPQTPSMKEKHEKAAAAGILKPLEGLSPAEKEKLLRAQKDMGIALPEGRTASEKALIAKIAAEPPPHKLPSEKLRRAKAAGLLTPLHGKTHDEKERILKGLAMEGIPLPEPSTASEKKLIDKINKELGLPPEPKTLSMKEKQDKAKAAGIIKPLEGLTAAEKEKVLRAEKEMGLELPEGRTASEKALIAKIKAEGPPPKIPSEKLRRAKAAGLLTPLAGKSKQEKERILRGLAKEGIPLPEATTASEKKLTDKIRKELGLPPEPQTPSMKEKHEKAAAAGILKPLEGLSPAEKEKLLRAQKDMGIALPEGRTASEKALIAKIAAEPPPHKLPSEKLRRAKAAGLLTPLHGKTHDEKERILKGLAMEGIPLPEPSTASEKKLIDKINKELGLPPEPKTLSMKEKQDKAKAAGIIKPLEGLTAAEKEKVLRAEKEMGLELPEGRTASEKALIAKIKAEGPPPKIPSEKLRRAKAAGLLTPLAGKSKQEKERILRGLAKEGIPLPEATTASDKKLTDKIRKELGLPPEPQTPSMKEKHEKAAAAGILKPLEGLSPAEKEKLLRAQKDMGIALPEGRTASEKALIAKIAAEPPPHKLPSEKLRRAKAAGLLTPLHGKTHDEKERILKGLAMEGIPLPEPSTASEKKLIDKINKELGLPPEPKTLSMKEKQDKAKAAGIIKPLEGLTAAEKEKVLRAEKEMGLELPEGRTASEKALIAKIKAEGPPPKIPSEKLRRAKAAGLLTPLAGKSKQEKERILRGLAKEGIPLPEATTASEKKLTDKIRKELGLPPEPQTPSMKEKHEKAAAAGILKPLEGLSPAEKEKLLRAQKDMGIALPEGRTASEKALIAKIAAEPPPHKLPSEKLRRAKAAGLLTPLHGKTHDEKERILKGLAMEGIPLPEPSTASEKKLIDKINKELGLPPEPKTLSMKEKQDKAKAAGIIKPLEGLTTAEKEKVLRAEKEMGLELPEGRTASEKALIAKIKAEGPPSKIPSEKLRRAKAAGLLTPLAGKSKQEKERILRGLAKEGIPLPEATTASEKKLTDKIRKELGLPPEPKTPSMREKHEKAAAAGVLKPLEGLSPAEKEKVLRAQADMGIALPEGRTASEKALIAKIKAEQEPSKIPSEKLRKAKAAGLLTPLEGKTQAQKEKIIKGLAEAGLPLPEGKTPSEKALITKVRTELGLPPPAKTPSEKSTVRKAKAEGLFTPLAGKSAKEKERILKGLADAGLPMPEGKTASEKELIKKIRAQAGLPLEPTPSEKRGEIKTKSKRIGVTPSKKVFKGIGVGAVTKSKAGIGEEFEDIIKTTTCDRGCGCDKKKIRFKHSYVKIRVTSPDISSLCPCPEECLPGVKAGAFIDNEGIKVTVGRVDGVPSYTSQHSNDILESSKDIVTLYDKILSNYCSSKTSTIIVDTSLANTFQPSKKDSYESNKIKNLISSQYTTNSYNSHSSFESYKNESDLSSRNGSLTACYDKYIDKLASYLSSSNYFESSADIYRRSASITFFENSSRGSFDSILIVKSESSLNLSTNLSSGTSTNPSCMDIISVISFSNSSDVSNSTHYLYLPISDGNFSNSTVEELESFTNSIDYCSFDTVTSDSSSIINIERLNGVQAMHRENETVIYRRKKQEYFTYRLSQTKISTMRSVKTIRTRKTHNGEPVIVINDLNSSHDITSMVDELLSNNEFSNASSIFVMVPTSDDNDSDNSSDCSSTICIQVSEHYSSWKRHQHEVDEPALPQRVHSRGLRISSRGKKFLMDGMQDTVASYHKKDIQYKFPKVCQHQEIQRTKNKLCQISTPKELLRNLCNGVSTDTTSDRPCCCAPKQRKEKKIQGDIVQELTCDDRCTANVVSDLITPLLVHQGISSRAYKMSTRSISRQASFLSMIRSTNVSPCQIPPCAPHPTTCHVPADMYEIPFGTPMPKFTPKPKRVDPCLCNPEKFKGLLEQALKAGMGANLKTTGCGPDSPRQPSPKQTAKPCPALKSTTKSTKEDEDCPACSKHKYKDGMQMECVCKGTKKTVNIKPLCPCEQHQPPVSQSQPGPKEGTRSCGGQCCICDPSKPAKVCTKRKLFGQKSAKSATKVELAKDILGPAGGMSKIEPEGTFTQAGMKPSMITTTTKDSSTNPKKHCECSGNSDDVISGNGKKKKNNIICECPLPICEPEPEPQPEPCQPEPYFLPDPYCQPECGGLPQIPKYLLEKYGQNENLWIDLKEALKQRSDMTQTHSGFKLFKKRKPKPPPEEDLTIEDAIRYYTIIHPDILKDICPSPSQMQGLDFRGGKFYRDCSCEAGKYANPCGECECPKGTTPSCPPVPDVCPAPVCEPVPRPNPPDAVLETTKEEAGPFRGFKFSMGGKGSGSKGLSGVCCFDMMEIQKSRSSRHSN